MQATASTNIQNQEKPNLKTLKRVLRAKYPQSKFQTVYLSKKPFWEEYTVYSAFCAPSQINFNAINSNLADCPNNALNSYMLDNQRFRRKEKWKDFFVDMERFPIFVPIKKNGFLMLFLKEWHKEAISNKINMSQS
jgi:hypothetical protein